MGTAARLPLAAWRNELCVRTIRFVGIDLTGQDMRAQIRLGKDVPSALVSLTTVTTTATEGLKLDSVVVTDGVPVSTVILRINKSTMSDPTKIPYGGERGDDVPLKYAVQIGGTTRLVGDFIALGTVMDSEAAPISIPANFARNGGADPWSGAQLTMGDEVTNVVIDGAELLAPMVAAAAMSAAAAAASEAVFRRDTVFYVSPTGTAGAAGTRAAPWSYAYSHDPANLAQPGDVILHDYDGVNLVGNATIRWRKGGTTPKPITHLAAPGRKPIVDFRILAPGGGPITWTLIDPVLHIWESDQAFSPGVALPISGSIKLIPSIPFLAQWYPLIPARGGTVPFGAQMTATDDQYRVDGAYYSGPMIERVQVTGKFRIRLDPRSAATMLNRTITYPTDTNPNNNDIALTLGDKGIHLWASNIISDGIVYQNAHATFAMASESSIAGTRQSNIEFRNGADYPCYTSWSFGGMDRVTVHDWTSDGGLREDWWGTYFGVKAGSTALEQVRKVAISPTGLTGITSSRECRFYRYTETNFFDGFIGGSGISFGLRDPSDPTSDEKAWANRCNFLYIWDDAFQIGANNRLLNIEDCYFDGAGVSRDGGGSGAATGVLGIPRIRRNVFVSTKQILYGELGAVDGSGGPSLAGLRYPAPLSSHGVNSSASAWTQPWDFQQNLVAFPFPSVANGNFQLALKNNNNQEGEKNVLSNNVFIITGASATTGNNTAQLDQALFLGAGREIIDGNVWIDTTGNLWTGAAGYNQAIVRFVYLNGVLVDDPNGGQGWRDFGQIRANTALLAASKIGYAPGLFSQEVVLTGSVRPVDTLVDLISTRPVLPALKSGAVDLTNLYPNLGTYRPQRGARSAL